MPDWAIVLVAAFGGGLAGAVLQPVMDHVLQRIRREEETRKRRERHLRRMVVAQMEWARQTVAAIETLHRWLKQGREVSKEWREQAIKPDEHSPFWQPERISDPDLREDARLFGSIARDLRSHVRLASSELGIVLVNAIRDLQRLERQMTARMDELNWPEVDE